MECRLDETFKELREVKLGSVEVRIFDGK